jgi:hypothetical protein
MSNPLLQKFLSEELGPTLARAALGGGAGAYFGHEVTPKFFGYEGDDAATNTSTMLNAILYGTLAGMGPKAVGASLKKNPELAAMSVAGGELFPVGMHMAQEGTKAIKDFNPPTAMEQAETVLKLPESRGAMGGAAVAGIGALLTGLMRSKSEKERLNSSSRAGMVSNDFLKYLLPAMVAGGVLGNVTKGDQPQEQ